jgi:hypothetical protein
MLDDAYIVNQLKLLALLKSIQNDAYINYSRATLIQLFESTDSNNFIKQYTTVIENNESYILGESGTDDSIFNSDNSNIIFDKPITKNLTVLPDANNSNSIQLPNFKENNKLHSSHSSNFISTALIISDLEHILGSRVVLTLQRLQGGTDSFVLLYKRIFLRNLSSMPNACDINISLLFDIIFYSGRLYDFTALIDYFIFLIEGCHFSIIKNIFFYFMRVLDYAYPLYYSDFGHVGIFFQIIGKLTKALSTKSSTLRKTIGFTGNSNTKLSVCYLYRQAATATGSFGVIFKIYSDNLMTRGGGSLL